jgi:hypothetical protein
MNETKGNYKILFEYQIKNTEYFAQTLECKLYNYKQKPIPAHFTIIPLGSKICTMLFWINSL